MGKDTRKVTITHFTRKPRKLGNFSVEEYFDVLRKNISKEYNIRVKTMPFESSGILKRLINIIYTKLNQTEINHITGDIHYVNFLLPKKRTILTILDCGLLKNQIGIKFHLLNLIWFKLPVKKSAEIIAISSETKREIIQYTQCQSSKIKVIYVCINPNFIYTPKSFNKAQPRILQIGTAPNKNIDRLILALKDISCTLVVIGKLNEEQKKLIIEHNIHVELFERKLSNEEIVEQYHKCDIVSFISTLEGFGMPIIEANAIGRTVITANISSMPEIANDAAMLVDPYNIEAMNTGFKDLINNNQLREQLIQNGIRNKNKFDITAIAIEHEQIYKSIISSLF